VENIAVDKDSIAVGEDSLMVAKSDSHTPAFSHEKFQLGVPMERDPPIRELEEFIDIVLNRKLDSTMSRRLSKRMIHR
jgi:hypothetical protein